MAVVAQPRAAGAELSAAEPGAFAHFTSAHGGGRTAPGRAAGRAGQNPAAMEHTGAVARDSRQRTRRSHSPGFAPPGGRRTHGARSTPARSRGLQAARGGGAQPAPPGGGTDPAAAGPHRRVHADLTPAIAQPRVAPPGRRGRTHRAQGPPARSRGPHASARQRSHNPGRATGRAAPSPRRQGPPAVSRPAAARPTGAVARDSRRRTRRSHSPGRAAGRTGPNPRRRGAPAMSRAPRRRDDVSRG